MCVRSSPSVVGCLCRSRGLKESRSGLWRMFTGGGFGLSTGSGVGSGWSLGFGKDHSGGACMYVWRCVGLGRQSCRRNPARVGKNQAAALV